MLDYVAEELSRIWYMCVFSVYFNIAEGPQVRNRHLCSEFIVQSSERTTGWHNLSLVRRFDFILKSEI